MVHRRLLIGLIILVSAVTTFALAQQYALRYLELTQISHTPGEVILSPDYQTIIEFEGLSVETASSGRADQITVELDEQMIRIRANKDVVNTDLTVIAGGNLALFTLRSDPASSSARRYLVLNK